MLVTTLGTSHGNPTYCRYTASTLLETDGRLYLVDAGEPVVASMIRRGKNLDNLKGVFISHMHNDHVSGLPGLIKMLRKYPRPGKHTAIFMAEDQYAALGAWLGATRVGWPLDMVTPEVTRPGEIYDDGTVKVHAQGTRHVAHSRDAAIPGSYAYVFQAEGKRVVFTGDLKNDFSDFPQAVRSQPCDACVCELTHFPPGVALPVLMAAPIKRLIFSHIHDPWHGDGEKKVASLFADLPYPWHIAKDGDEFAI